MVPAVRRFRDLILEGKNVAEKWGQTDVAEALKTREKSLADFLLTTNAEQWQINPAIHYNEWTNFTANDFIPVVTAFRNLVSKFSCEKPECAGLFYLVMTPPKTPDAVRCTCGNTNINLRKPEK